MKWILPRRDSLSRTCIVCMHTYVCVNICIHVCTSVLVYMGSCVYVLIFLCLYMYIYVPVGVQVNMCMWSLRSMFHKWAVNWFGFSALWKYFFTSLWDIVNIFFMRPNIHVQIFLMYWYSKLTLIYSWWVMSYFIRMKALLMLYDI